MGVCAASPLRTRIQMLMRRQKTQVTLSMRKLICMLVCGN